MSALIVRKTGVTFPFGLQSHKNVNGLEGTMSGRVRTVAADGTYGAWEDITTTFTEEVPGTFTGKYAFTNPGNYQIEATSTDDRLGNFVANYRVDDADLTDINAKLTQVLTDLGLANGKLDVLDDDILAQLNTRATSIDDALTALNNLVGAEDPDDGILSIVELIEQLKTAGTDRDSLINTISDALTAKVDDVEPMLRGDEFLSDGTTANPYYGKNTPAVYDLLTTVQTEMGAAKDAIIAHVTAKATEVQNAILTPLAEAKTVIDYNKAKLDNADHGLEAIMAGIDGLDSGGSSNTQTIVDLLEDATNGLAAIKTAVMDKLGVIEGKVDTANDKLDTLITGQANNVQSNFIG
jgi:hypothetical protein